MVSLVQPGMYSVINKIYPTTSGYNAVKYLSEAYTLQEDTSCDGKISMSGKLILKYQYLICMKTKKKWYWEQTQKQQVIVVTTFIIFHPCLDFIVVKDLQDIRKGICNINIYLRGL